jgi:hypothetical protein
MPQITARRKKLAGKVETGGFEFTASDAATGAK